MTRAGCTSFYNSFIVFQFLQVSAHSSKNRQNIQRVLFWRKRLRICLLCGKMILKLLSMRTIYEKSNPNAIF